MTEGDREGEDVSGGNCVDGEEGSRGRERLARRVKGARKSGGERGWRVPRQRFCSSTRETETSAVRAGERGGLRVKKRKIESFSASRENDSRRTNEKGSTMTAKRAHSPRRFDLSVLESLKRGRRGIITIYIRTYVCNGTTFRAI